MADDRKGSEGWRPSWGLIIGIVLGLAALDFVLQNRRDVGIHFLFFESDRPLWLVLLVTSALAIGAAELIGIAIRRSRQD
jgi:uncharacterized integral membrane protein